MTILQELAHLYERKMQEPDSGMPREGYSKQIVHGVLRLDGSGKWLETYFLGEKKGNRRVVPLMESPTIPQRSGKRPYEKPGFVAERFTYIFGQHSKVSKPQYTQPYQTLLRTCLEETGDAELAGYLRFLGRVAQGMLDENEEKKLDELLALNPEPTLGVIVAADQEEQVTFLWERPALLAWYQQRCAESLDGDTEDKFPPVFGQCLVTGRKNVRLKRIHGKLKPKIIAENAAGLVDFNPPSSRSYGQLYSYNAPVSYPAEQAYVGALKYLYDKEGRNRLEMGGCVLAFWGEAETGFETMVRRLLAGDKTSKETTEEAGATETTEEVEPWDWEPFEQMETRFFMLGLSPNTARLSVRFWYSGTIKEVVQRFKLYLDELEIARGPFDGPNLSLQSLLRATTADYKLASVSPPLEAEILRSLLLDKPYPVSLLHTLTRRIVVDDVASHRRAALVKAYFNRQIRHGLPSALTKPIGITLDETNMLPAYRLGRFAAVCVQIQKDMGGLSSTRDYGAFLRAPRPVFIRLNNLTNRNLGMVKLRAWYSKLLTQIMASVAEVPANFTPEQQALFALGAYQQWLVFFAGKPQEAESTESETDE